MSEFWYRDAGTWRKAKELYYKDAGAWLKCKELWYRDAGTWRKVFSGFTLTGSNFSSSTTTTVSPQVRFQTDGSLLRKMSDNSYTTLSWGTPYTSGIGANYWIKVHQVSGSAVTGTLDAVLALSAEQVWTMSAASAGSSKTANLSYTIYLDSAGTLVGATGTITLVSDRT